ncbi:hypothetical protein PR048_002039 [Dryococelus australis]|uniref:Uncharacterized protein n=1 Tax=Dryococelus australis TaxID=614101 RepID=A0ABQ9IKI0_9NEOP|nr:hypothetical protein PR048_002039 [Dryococelus australis]
MNNEPFLNNLNTIGIRLIDQLMKVQTSNVTVVAAFLQSSSWEALRHEEYASSYIRVLFIMLGLQLLFLLQHFSYNDLSLLQQLGAYERSLSKSDRVDEPLNRISLNAKNACDMKIEDFRTKAL